MTTRKEKRLKRQTLIYRLEDLETTHCFSCTVRETSLKSSDDVCKGCPIYTKIRAIGDKLAPNAIVDICTASGLTEVRYHAMCKKDMSDEEIATEIKVSKSTLQKWKKKNNIVRKRPGFELSVARYTKLREKGMTYGDIAEKLHCGLRVLTRWIKKNNASDIKRGKK